MKNKGYEWKILYCILFIAFLFMLLKNRRLQRMIDFIHCPEDTVYWWGVLNQQCYQIINKNQIDTIGYNKEKCQ